MTKAEIITEISSKTGIEKVSVQETVEAFFKVVKTSMVEGENVYVRGFGITRLSWKIYNRWGTLVFETIDKTLGWDGTYKGQTLPIGTYYWVFEGMDKYKEVKMVSSGAVTILK